VVRSGNRLGLGTKHPRDGFLEEHQDVQFPEAGSAWKLATNIFDTIRSDERTAEAGRRALVESFVKAYNYERARLSYQLLAKETYLSSEELRRLEYAVQTNRQVYEANLGEAAIPTLVKALVEKFEPPAPPADDPWGTEPPF
jgi:hypothetical protein